MAGNAATMAADDYRLGDQIGFILRKANQRHTAIFARMMIGELTPTQWAVLVTLADQGPLSQNLLGRETAMDGATIKGVVDRLLKRGLLTATPDREDGRRSLIDLATDGRALVEAGRPVAAAITEQTLAGLDRQQRKTLLSLLDAIS